MKIYLYRSERAIGAASHWAAFGPHIEGYTPLGIGELSRGKDGAPRITSEYVYLCKGIEANQLKGADK